MMNTVPGKVSAMSVEEGIWFIENADNSWNKLDFIAPACVVRKTATCNYYQCKCFWNQPTDTACSLL
jgi:hypothetical protein